MGHQLTRAKTGLGRELDQLWRGSPTFQSTERRNGEEIELRNELSYEFKQQARI